MLPPELLEEMRAEYLQNLRAKLTRIPSLWRELAAAPESTNEELLRIVHSIAGSGGTFGFPRVSQAAMALEIDLQEGADNARIEAGIARLAAEAAGEAAPG